MGYLELDYHNRVKEEYKDEIGLYGNMDLPTYLDQNLVDSIDAGKSHKENL